jgi:hypothetical protein
MEKMTVIALLDKYWQAETTLEEEKALADYFRGPAVDPELATYSEIFVYFDEEARVVPSPDLGDRILQHIGIATDGAGVALESQSTAPYSRRVAPSRKAAVIRPFGTGLLSAAAVIAALIAGLFLLTPPQQQSSAVDAGTSLATIRHGAIQDTYDDPEQALAAVRRALLVASTHLNEGRQELTGDRK